MRVVGQRILRKSIERYAELKPRISAWLCEAKEANWNTPQDIKNRYSSVSFLKDQVVVFNIKGNKYRLETKVSYKLGEVRILWIGTHKEYNKRNKLLKR